MKIAFHTNSLSVRGTEIALYDYAFHSQALLGHDALVFHRVDLPVVPSVLEKFSRHFSVYAYRDMDELNRLLERERADLCYFIKSGERDGLIASACPSAIHAVFPTAPAEFHGTTYAFVSEWLSKEYSNRRISYVPHMIDLPEVLGDLRMELGISPTQTVLGYYGGADSFNLRFAQAALGEALERRSDLQVIMMNVTPFAQHERLLFLPASADLARKVQFIQTCDAMIHARGIGESFGLACGEFSIKNKPVITYALSPQRSHLEILGNKALLYKGKGELMQLLLNVDRSWQHQQSWDAYSKQFHPRAVMDQFARIFLQEPSPGIASLSSWDQLVIVKYRLARKLRSLTRKLYR
jgi:hypothetical protein